MSKKHKTPPGPSAERLDTHDGPLVAGEDASTPALADVVELHPKSPDVPVDASPRIVWIVPRGRGRPIAHAYREGARTTLCGSASTDLAVYPPAPSLVHCETCERVANESEGES